MVNLFGWPFGVFLSFLASIIGVIGKIVVKLSYQPNINVSQGKCWWGSGMILIVIVNPVLCIAAYKFAPQSLLAPIGGLCVVWNTVFSPCLLKETLRTRDIFGAAVIFVGCIIVSVVGSHKTHDIPLDQLGLHFTSAIFLIYLSGFLILMIILFRQAWPALLYATGKKDFGDEYKTICCRVSLASLSGCLSGQLFLMCSLLRISHNNPKDIFASPLVYIIALTAFGLAVAGLYLMNTALMLYDAILIIYIYEATLIMSGAISGICFFHDMKDLTSWHWIVYGVGVGLIVYGIIVLSNGERRRPSTFPDDLHAVKQTLL